MFESVYRECLVYELLKSDLLVFKEKAIPVVYEGIKNGFSIQGRFNSK
jgi:hypothetical protein